jgi:hypothetical protein
VYEWEYVATEAHSRIMDKGVGRGTGTSILTAIRGQHLAARGQGGRGGCLSIRGGVWHINRQRADGRRVKQPKSHNNAQLAFS